MKCALPKGLEVSRGVYFPKEIRNVRLSFRLMWQLNWFMVCKRRKA